MMQKNKNLFLASFLFFASTYVLAGGVVVVVPQDQRTGLTDAEYMILPTPANGIMMTAGGLISMYGGLKSLWGAYKFFQSSENISSAKTLSDYTRAELATLSQEKLARVIALENERRKEAIEKFTTFLSGALWAAVGTTLTVYGAIRHGERVKADYAEYKKTHPTAP